MYQKILSLCLSLLLMAALPLTAEARSFDPQQPGSVSVTLTDRESHSPIAGAELHLHYVATVRLNQEGSLAYTYTADFEDIGVPLNDANLASALQSYAAKGIGEVGTMTTDAQGRASCADLRPGLYFVRQPEAAGGFAPCKPFLVTLPMAENGDYIYHVDASPKTEVARLTPITIRKVWNTDASAEAADSVTVQLLLDGEVVETAVLNAENGWKVTYEDMPRCDGYTVREIGIPNGFTATYSREGYDFTVTNTAALIQTGQLLWPIPVLGAAGILLLAVGVLLLCRREDGHA